MFIVLILVMRQHVAATKGFAMRRNVGEQQQLSWVKLMALGVQRRSLLHVEVHLWIFMTCS